MVRRPTMSRQTPSRLSLHQEETATAAAAGGGATAAAAATARMAGATGVDRMMVRRPTMSRQTPSRLSLHQEETATVRSREEMAAGAGTVTVRTSTGLQERRAGTYYLEDDGEAAALPVERVRTSLRTE